MKLFQIRYFALVSTVCLILVLIITLNSWTYQKQDLEAKAAEEVDNFEKGCIENQDESSEYLLPFSYYKARFDSRNMIRIYDWVWVGSKWDQLMDVYDVCIATQSSLDRLHWIPKLAENWEGPISLSIFIRAPSEWIALNLLMSFFRRCYPAVLNYVSVHMAIPVEVGNLNWSAFEYDSMEWLYTCNQTTEFVDHVLEKCGVVDDSIMYPQNHMRNIARSGCGTDWVYSTDIDIIPRPGSAKSLQEFYEFEEVRNCEKCAFVIPTYELDKSVPYPESKLELVEYAKAGLARPFHSHYFKPGHAATGYLRWQKTLLDEDEVIRASHRVDAKHAKNLYEPFYISSNKIPLYDERFIGYGFTRNSQFKEADIQKWDFQVLTPIFGIHWGLQTNNTIISPGKKLEIRKNQTRANGRIYKKFIEELNCRFNSKPVDKVTRPISTATRKGQLAAESGK